MAQKDNNLFNSINVTRNAQAAAKEEETALADLMANPEYLRHSSAVIHEALKEGFDVLQLPNGDIVTTGTKVITNTFSWDKSKGKLVKARTADKPAATKRSAKAKSKETTED